MRKILLIMLFTSACGMPQQNSAPVPVTPKKQLVEMGICDAPIVPTCENGVAVGCSFMNGYSDLDNSNQLWTATNGVKFVGFCHYGGDHNSCPSNVVCPKPTP